MYKFTIEEVGTLKLTGLKKLLADYANDQWLPDHATPQQAVEIVRDMFMRQLKADLEKLELKCGSAEAGLQAGDVLVFHDTGLPSGDRTDETLNVYYGSLVDDQLSPVKPPEPPTSAG